MPNAAATFHLLQIFPPGYVDPYFFAFMSNLQELIISNVFFPPAQPFSMVLSVPSPCLQELGLEPQIVS
jgi:hypothetical protein